MPSVTSSHNAAGLVRVYINDALHLAFSAATLAGLQSWKMTTREPPMYAVEITSAAGAEILAEYDSEPLWRAVLAEIDKALGPVSAAHKEGSTP